jgi:tyrosinase
VNVEIKLPKYDAQNRAFVTWRPVQATARILNPRPAPTSFTIRLATLTTGNGGQLSFATKLTHKGADSLDLKLPADGTPVPFWVGGKFGFPSLTYGDVSIEARELVGGAAVAPVLGKQPLMVRVRKNANLLTNAERDRFVAAMAALNGSGQGIFKQFRGTHVDSPAREQLHGSFGFLPWHRAFLLDLERELQKVDAAVALPFWRFDQPAPNLISKSFIGLPDANGRAQFSPGNPLGSWVSDNPGILRGLGVKPNNIPQPIQRPPPNPPFFVLTQAQTLNLSSGPSAKFSIFRQMESTPHGAAHSANWDGDITDITTAARDPLFFLLHCNVDRLWAMWQWLNKRYDPTLASSYGGSGLLKGHNLNDTMWPWDGDKYPPRPDFALRQPLAGSPMTAAPGDKPKVRDMLDYLGIGGGADQGFAYADVPFQN